MNSAPAKGRADGRIRRRVEHLMGMPISLALRGRHASSVAGDEAWQSVINQLREADEIFSTYRADSIIRRLDRGELTIEQCPPEVAEVIELGREAERVSDGAFSIRLPTPDGRRRLDPSGVVKGWAVQRAAGGDIVCHTGESDRASWRIGIEHPLDPTTLIAVVPIRSGSVATSGTAHRGGHLLDPHTGRQPSGVASVTVIAASLTWADIDATAAYVKGHDAARWLQTRPIRSALVVWADGTTTRLPKDPL
jgi:FAD:protein FMN transferase